MSLMVIGLFKFSISSCFSFVYIFLGICFFQIVHFIAIYLLIIFSYYLYFCCVGCDLSSFIRDFISLVPFLIQLASGLSMLLIISKNKLLVSLICSTLLCGGGRGLFFVVVVVFCVCFCFCFQFR